MDVKQNPKSQIPNPNDGQLTGQVSGGSREVEKPVLGSIQIPTTAETAPVLEQELKDIGAESHSDLPELDETHEQVGIIHSPSDTPVRTDSQTITLPMTEEEAQSAMAKYKNKVTYDIGEHGEHDAYVVPSRLGLATLVDKINKFINLFKPRKRATA